MARGRPVPLHQAMIKALVVADRRRAMPTTPLSPLGSPPLVSWRAPGRGDLVLDPFLGSARPVPPHLPSPPL